jgi:serine/threonine-protein kinase
MTAQPFNPKIERDTPGPRTLAIGAVLQETYRILRPLAEGGCGEVYLAAHTRLPGRFAVKMLHRSLARDAEALSRFRQEAEITSTLRHPHIVQVFDFNVTESGFPYLVMELLQGQLLSHRLAAAGALDPPTAVKIVEQISYALHAAHARGIVHRDLKPDNVMLLTGDGVADFVKVMDFGISKASWRPRLTDGASVAGTPQYMAPEQALGQREEIDHRTDQFSLAAIAYNLLTGQEAFHGDDPIAVVYQVVHVDPTRPSALVPGLGTEVDAVIMRGLSKEASARYPNVLLFSAALRAAIDGPVVLAERRPSDEPPPVRTTPPPARATPPPARPTPPPARATPRPARATPPPARTTPPLVLALAPRPEEAFPAPPVAAIAFDGPAAEPADFGLEPDSQADLDADTMPVGQITVRLIRRMRWRMNRVPRRIALLALAAAGALAWFAPATRGATRAAWHRAEAKVEAVLGRAVAPHGSHQ